MMLLDRDIKRLARLRLLEQTDEVRSAIKALELGFDPPTTDAEYVETLGSKRPPLIQTFRVTDLKISFGKLDNASERSAVALTKLSTSFSLAGRFKPVRVSKGYRKHVRRQKAQARS